MTNKDKVLAAFLVSMGLFSLTQAVHYVKNLPDEQKNALMPAVNDSARQKMLDAVCAVIMIHGGTNSTNTNTPDSGQDNSKPQSA